MRTTGLIRHFDRSRRSGRARSISVARTCDSNSRDFSCDANQIGTMLVSLLLVGWGLFSAFDSQRSASILSSTSVRVKNIQQDGTVRPERVTVVQDKELNALILLGALLHAYDEVSGTASPRESGAPSGR